MEIENDMVDLLLVAVRVHSKPHRRWGDHNVVGLLDRKILFKVLLEQTAFDTDVSGMPVESMIAANKLPTGGPAQEGLDPLYSFKRYEQLRGNTSNRQFESVGSSDMLWRGGPCCIKRTADVRIFLIRLDWGVRACFLTPAEANKRRVCVKCVKISI